MEAVREGESQERVKPLLYVYRVLLTGIHLMRTGQINANLVELNSESNCLTWPTWSHTSSLAKRIAGKADVQFHQQEYEVYAKPWNTRAMTVNCPKRLAKQRNCSCTSCSSEFGCLSK